MIPLTELEQALLDAILAGEHPILEKLRAQFTASTTTHRRLSGVGFFTDFEVPASVPRIDTGHWVISDLLLDLPELKHGATIMLFVVDGVISMLEGVTNADESWPSSEAGFSIQYVRRDKRRYPAGWECVPSGTRDLSMFHDDYMEARSRGR